MQCNIQLFDKIIYFKYRIRQMKTTETSKNVIYRDLFKWRSICLACVHACVRVFVCVCSGFGCVLGN